MQLFPQEGVCSCTSSKSFLLGLNCRLGAGRVKTQGSQEWNPQNSGGGDTIIHILVQVPQRSRTRRMHTHTYIFPQSLSRVRLCDRMDRSPPGSSVHGIPQARILEWVIMLSPPGYLPNTGIKPWVDPALAGRFFTTEPSGKPTEVQAQGSPG